MHKDHLIFPWNHNFETGISIIDDQHKKLVDLINTLAAHLVNPNEDVSIHQIFKELVDYTHYHFETEEAIWAEHLDHTQLADEHLKTHHGFIDKVAALKGSGDIEYEGAVTEEILSFLTHWLTFHIIDTDKHMAKIVLALQEGYTLEKALEKASSDMSGSMRVLISTILEMYDSLSTKTLQLMREVTQRQRAEVKLKLSSSAINASLESIFITDKQGIIIDANPAFCQDLAMNQDQLLGQNIKTLKSSILSESMPVWESVLTDGHWVGEVKTHDYKKGSYWLSLSSIKDDEGHISHYAGVISSVTQILERQSMLIDAAIHDPLTGLHNRRSLDEQLNAAIARSKRSQQPLAVCFMDLDGFKAVNDLYGHEAGDQVLIEISQRLSTTIREVDALLRVGGDEFVMLLGDIASLNDVETLLGRIIHIISKPITLADAKQVQVGISIGFTLCTAASHKETLIHQADTAMYEAKRRGKNQFFQFKHE
ncbi:MAG: bacteriohemerythrin [Mariprofundaceae bacterium]